MAQDTKQLFTKLHNYMQVHSIPGMPGGNQSRIESMTYNPRYPGFDEANYRKLESKVDALGLVGNERQKAMDQLYVQVLPNVQNQILNSNRREYINDAAYEVSQIQDKSAKAQAKSKFTVTELAQQLKEKFNIDPTANDEDVFDSRVQSIPNGGQLLADYMNDGNPQLLYQGGLESVPEDARQKLKDNFWDSLWDNIKTKANVPIDNIKKWGQRTLNDLGANIYKNMLKRTLGDALPEKMGINIDNYVNTIDEKAITPTVQENIANYQNKINQAYAAKEQKNLDQDIKNYYDQKGYTEMLKEGDFRGFLFKGMGDAAQNWEMPVVVAASIFQPEVGMALMTTDAYARENQEAFENMMNNGATYEEAEQGAVAVGLVNAAVEVTLEKLIGGVETSASNAIRKTMLKNVQEEAAKKGLGRILLEGAGTQLRASGEEGLEEIVQQIVQNAAVKTVNENQDLFEGVGAAFEGGFYNPMNLLAGGGNLTQNINQNKDVVRQQIMDGAYNAGKAARTVTDMFKGTPAKSKNVWQKVVETSTRSIPEKVVENELRLTPTERKNVERYGITPANFVLKENIAGLSNADKVIALQDISSDAYNNVTNVFKNVIPQDYRTESKTAGKMLQTMIDTMEKSDIVKEEYADYIAKLKEMLDYSDFSPYEKLAIRRDFDAIVGNDIFGANGRVKGLEDQTIAKWRADLNEEINELGDEFGVDVKSENARIANAITIRDGLLRSLSQNKKNNAIGLQDLGIGAILSAGNPVQAGGVIAAKRLLENAAGNIAQGLYNKNNTPLTPANTKRGAGFIQKSNPNANNNFMISSSSSNIATNPQEELSTATEFVTSSEGLDKSQASSKNAKYQKYGVADPNSKSITAQEGLNIKDFRNGRTVEDIANQYGIKVDIVEKILTPAGEKALGMYDKGIITLAKDLKESTVPHELLHAAFDMVDASKRQSILNGIEKKLGVDAVNAEEWLADSFSEYYRTGTFGTQNLAKTFVEKIKQFFYEVKKFIDGTYQNEKQIQKLFDDIIAGNDLGSNTNGNTVFQNAGDIYSDNFKNWFGDWENKPETASKVVDKGGKPLVVYHGGPVDIKIFDRTRMGKNAQKVGPGFYFTDVKAEADTYKKRYNPVTEKYYNYEGDTPTTVDAYLSIKNPLVIGKDTLSKQQMVDILMQGDYNWAFENKINHEIESTDDLNLKEIDGKTYTPEEVKKMSKKQKVELYVQRMIEKARGYKDDLVLNFLEIVPQYYDSSTKGRVLDVLMDVTGKDGVIYEQVSKYDSDKKYPAQYVAWDNRQIKSASDNVGTYDPNNPDIRYQKKQAK